MESGGIPSRSIHDLSGTLDKVFAPPQSRPDRHTDKNSLKKQIPVSHPLNPGRTDAPINVSEKANKGFGTVHALKRYAGAYVADHSKLSEDETIGVLGKAAPTILSWAPASIEIFEKLNFNQPRNCPIAFILPNMSPCREIGLGRDYLS